MRKIDEQLREWRSPAAKAMSRELRLEKLAELIRGGADALRKDEGGWPSAVEETIARNDVEELRVMIEAGLDPSARIEGTPLLIKALEKGSLDCMEELVKKGADISAIDKRSGGCALWVAIRMDKETAARKLLAWGADTAGGSPRGGGAMEWALGRGALELALDIQERTGEPMEGPVRSGAIKVALGLERIKPSLWKRLEKASGQETLEEKSIKIWVGRLAEAMGARAPRPAIEWELDRIERAGGRGLREFVESAALSKAIEGAQEGSEANRRWKAKQASWEAEELERVGRQSQTVDAGEAATEEAWAWSLDSIRRQKQKAIETIQEQQRRLGDMEAIEVWLRVSEALEKWPGIERVRVRGIKNILGATSWMLDVEQKDGNKVIAWSVPIKMDPIARGQSGDESVSRSVEDLWGETGKKAFVELGRAWVSAMNREAWTEVWLPAKDKEALRRKMLTPEQMARSEKEEMEEIKTRARSAARL